jgi:hypothetical protein
MLMARNASDGIRSISQAAGQWFKWNLVGAWFLGQVRPWREGFPIFSLFFLFLVLSTISYSSMLGCHSIG